MSVSSSASSTIDAEILQAELQRLGIVNLQLSCFDELSSTNRYLTASAREHTGATPHLAITAVQTSGAGRRGRVWQSGHTAITFSIRQQVPIAPARAAAMSLMTGWCVADTVSRLTGVRPQLKWPNDVLAHGQKLAGILLEVPVSHPDSFVLVTGIGLNCAREPELQNVTQPWITLADLSATLPRRETVVAELVACYLGAVDDFVRDGWAAFAKRYESYDLLRDQWVDIHAAAGTRVGRVLGIDAAGGLEVQVDGQREVLNSGEVSVRHRPGFGPQ